MATQSATPSRAEGRKPSGLRKFFTVILIIAGFLLAAAAVIYFFVLKSPAQVSQPYAAGAKVQVRDGAYTFLLIGQRDNLTDTLMAAMLDTKKGTLNLVSIPRDTVTANKRRVPKINGAYIANGRGEKGLAQLMAEAAQILGYYPDSYCMVDMEAFVKLVDAMGGVTFEVPENMRLLSEGIDLQKGEQVLDGNKALQLVRYRSYTKAAGVGLNDFGRMEMQQRFLRAMAKQGLSRLSPALIQQALALTEEYAVTNLDTAQLGWLAATMWRIGEKNIHFATLPTVSVKYGDGSVAQSYYEQVDGGKALTMVNELLNPYTAEITADMVSHRRLTK